jgi:hypothetical protein
MAAVQNLCTKGIVIEQGRISLYADIDKAVSLYLANEKFEHVLNNSNVFIGENCEIYNTRLVNSNNLISNVIDLIIRTNFTSSINKSFSVILTVLREYELAFVAASFYKDEIIMGNEEYIIDITIPRYLLNPGFHSIDISIVDETGNFHQYLYAKEVLSFNVIDDNHRRGNKYNKGWGGKVSPILDIKFNKIIN